ncbi:MAG: hypothetical protein IJ649_05720 [Oscillospiraceae bacterium]|nr:hypothetical protein [Oscillospiraceae bacterium]
MKKLLSLLLTAALLLGPAAPAFAENDPAYAAAIEAQAFAVAMAYHEGGFFDGITPHDPALLWEASGWYAAWLYRTEGTDLLTEDMLRDFQRSLGVQNAPDAPDTPDIRILHSSDGLSLYDFQGYKVRLDDTLGQTLSFSLEAEAPFDAALTIWEYFSSEASSSRRYELRFALNRNAGSAFRYSLQNVSAEDPGPTMDPALGFDWDGLLAANSLKNIFSMYQSVRIKNSVEGIMPIWLFLRDGKLCILRTSENYIEGQYNGCWFFVEPGEDGVMRPRIAGFDEQCGSLEFRDNYVSDYLYGASIVNLDRVDGDWIRMHVDFMGDWSEAVAVDRGLLLLRETVSRIDDETLPIVTGFFYGETPPEAKYLDSWKGPMRHITLHWEDWRSGGPSLRTETVEVPADWEYLPWEARWDEYTIYMNEGYTKPYAYPGDGTEDYELYLTTAKG